MSYQNSQLIVLLISAASSDNRWDHGSNIEFYKILQDSKKLKGFQPPLPSSRQGSVPMQTQIPYEYGPAKTEMVYVRAGMTTGLL